MPNIQLTATLTQTCDRKPLATVDGLPGGNADLTPAQLRVLAESVLRIAADAEARPMAPRSFIRQRRVYSSMTSSA